MKRSKVEKFIRAMGYDPELVSNITLHGAKSAWVEYPVDPDDPSVVRLEKVKFKRDRLRVMDVVMTEKQAADLPLGSTVWFNNNIKDYGDEYNHFVKFGEDLWASKGSNPFFKTNKGLAKAQNRHVRSIGPKYKVGDYTDDYDGLPVAAQVYYAGFIADPGNWSPWWTKQSDGRWRSGGGSDIVLLEGDGPRKIRHLP